MKREPIESQLQARVQADSDRLADALAAGEDTTAERQALDKSRAALRAHQQAEQAAAAERSAAAAAASDEVAEVAAEQATAAVNACVARVVLPSRIEPPASTHPAVAAVAAEAARIRHEIERSGPELATVRNEVSALVKRADAKRLAIAAIRSRRLAGHEKDDDAAQINLLTADAADLDNLVQSARQHLAALEQPFAELRKRLADAETKLAAAQVDAELHGQADRVRALEAALVEGVRALRSSLAERKLFNLPTYFTPTQALRDVANGIAPR